MSHRVVLIRASLEECGTADAHSTPRGRGLTMPRIPDTLVPGGERAPLLPRTPPPLGGSERRSCSGLARLAFGCASHSAPDLPTACGRASAVSLRPPLLVCI